MINDTDKAYIAGLFDGEGHFVTPKHNGKINHWAFVITSTDLEVLEWCKSKYGFGYISKDKRELKHPNWKPCYTWRVCKKENIVTLFKDLSPYLKIKKEGYYK